MAGTIGANATLVSSVMAASASLLRWFMSSSLIVSLFVSLFGCLPLLGRFMSDTEQFISGNSMPGSSRRLCGKRGATGAAVRQNLDQPAFLHRPHARLASDAGNREPGSL